MIPTMILVGLVLGFLPLPRDHRLALTAILAVVAALVWGIVVDVLIGGALLALANIAVGVLVATGLRALGHAVFHRPAH